jgi:DNA gyrase/topoisomerase IV subunit B
MADENDIAHETKYIDDDYVRLENEFEQIQVNVGMYISYTGTDGAVHLFKEIFNNALDECINENSPADKIEIYFDEKTREIVVMDNGRGIPFDKMIEVCSEKHTSTKFGRKQNLYSAGCHGVGLKVTVALSDYFSMTCYRGYECKTIEYNNCKIKEGRITKLKKEQYGTTIKFVPSEKYLGRIDITVDHISEWLRLMSYIIPEGIKMKYVGSKQGSEAIVNRTYKREGLVADIEHFSIDHEFPPIDLSITDEKMELEFAFIYDKAIDDEIIDSFCNYVHTIDGGYHVQACERAICEFMTKEAKKQDPSSNYEVCAEDCRKGLVLVINCLHQEPRFGG